MDLLSMMTHEDSSGWRPEEPPSLDGVHEIELDLETNGLRWDAGHRPIGVSVFHHDRGWYLPFGHLTGGNLDENMVREWARRELRGKHITNLNTRFDVHHLYQWGVDLEAQGCTLSDVGHHAALLDDHRQRFSLASLCEDFLPDERKVEVVNGVKLDASRMAYYHPKDVAVRGIADVRQVNKLKQIFLPKIQEEELERVLKTEEELIYVVCEMERNGQPIDLARLKRFREECESELQRIVWDIWHETGLRFNPNVATDWEKLCQRCGVWSDVRTATGKMSIADDVLAQFTHPLLIKARRASKLDDLLSKAFRKLERCVGPDGILRYALHQLRTDKNEKGRGAGTISGRFSSTELFDGVGTNLQQIFAVEKQISDYGPDWIVRELMISDLQLLEGTLPAWVEFLSADAKQIEYRIFASYVANPRIIEAYRKNPDISFHEYMHERLRPFKPDLGYKPLKNLNFAYIYGAGLAKIAMMMGYITEKQLNELRRKYPNGVPRTEPMLAKALEIVQIYERELPEARPLLERASNLARDRGYVKTIMGRRSRFPDGQRLHKAFNAVDQGSAADVMKVKLIELHKNREYTGLILRGTNHDEVIGTTTAPETSERVREILNTQSFPELKVPIRWDVDTGPHWAACDKDWRKLQAA